MSTTDPRRRLRYGREPMSSLWTPGGEHPVDRPGTDQSSSRASAPPPTRPPADEPERELTPEERAAAEEYARQVEEAREQLLAAPVGLVVGQQALQMFGDLAGLYLSLPDPRINDARMAIDALAAVLDSLGPRLGEAEAALRNALTQLQMAVVEVANRSGDETGGPAAAPDG
jgi:hypothetical protein